MRRIHVGIIGTGWIGEIRARTCAAHALVEGVHLAEIDEAKLARVAKETGAKLRHIGIDDEGQLVWDDAERLMADLQFIRDKNRPVEDMKDEDIRRLREIANRRLPVAGHETRMLTDDELRNLVIRRGSLTEEECERLGKALLELDTALEEIKVEQGIGEAVQSVRDGLDDIVDGVIEGIINPGKWQEQTKESLPV